MPHCVPLVDKTSRERRARSSKEATTALLRRRAAHSLPLLLHDLADLHARVEELCGAAVEADGLALVELALAVVGRDALLLARLLETIHDELESATEFHRHTDIPSTIVRRRRRTSSSSSSSSLLSSSWPRSPSSGDPPRERASQSQLCTTLVPRARNRGTTTGNPTQAATAGRRVNHPPSDDRSPQPPTFHPRARARALRQIGDRGGKGEKAYRLYVSAIMRISPSTAAIFCSDVGCWRPIPRNDMLGERVFGGGRWWRSVVGL